MTDEPARLRTLFLQDLVAAAGVTSLLAYAAGTLGVVPDAPLYLVVFVGSVLVYWLDHGLDAWRAGRRTARKQVAAAVVAAAAGVLLLLALLPARVLPAVLLPGAVGLAYGLPVVPGRRGEPRRRRPKDLPGTKAWLVALATTAGVVGPPWAWGGFRPDRELAALVLFVVPFLAANTHVFDLRDHARDRRDELPTLVVLLGPRRVRRLVLGLLGAAALALGLLGRRGVLPLHPEALVSLAFAAVYVVVLDDQSPRRAFLWLADGSLFLPLVLRHLPSVWPGAS